VSRIWHRFHAWPRRYRWPLKCIVFAAVVLLVLYPKPWLIPTWLHRLSNLDAVVDPDHPQIVRMQASISESLGEDADLQTVLEAVQQAVCARVPYAFDWETWGVMDYLPTVGEVFAQGREDCDGRAVVAASVLRRMHYDAHLVTDLKHMWVAGSTIDAETGLSHQWQLMHPGKGERSLVGAEGGTSATLSAGTLANLGWALSFGIAAFPLVRELIVLVAVCGLTMQPRSSTGRRVAGCAMLAGTLALFRVAGSTGDGIAASLPLAGLALLALVGGWLLLAIKRKPKVAGRHGGEAPPTLA
jgi:hypothetical protein